VVATGPDPSVVNDAAREVEPPDAFFAATCQ
jgi:hypothetical protein